MTQVVDELFELAVHAGLDPASWQARVLDALVDADQEQEQPA